MDEKTIEMLNEMMALVDKIHTAYEKAFDISVKQHEITADALAGVMSHKDNESLMMSAQKDAVIALKTVESMLSEITKKHGRAEAQKIFNEASAKVSEFAEKMGIEDFRHSLTAKYDSYFENSKNAE